MRKPYVRTREQNRLQVARYRAKYPEKVRAYQKKYRDEHKEHINLLSRQSAARNRERVRERSRKYGAANREQIGAWNRKWRAENAATLAAKRKIYYQKNRKEILTKCKERGSKPEVCERKRAYATRCRDRLYERHLIRKLGSHAPDHFADQALKQGGKCAVCGAIPNKRRLNPDHSHTTGQLRGLLCQPCNVTLGQFRERAEVLRKLADYIDFWNLQKAA